MCRGTPKKKKRGHPQSHIHAWKLSKVSLNSKWNVFSINRMCSLEIECVLKSLSQNVFSINRMCSLQVCTSLCTYCCIDIIFRISSKLVVRAHMYTITYVVLILLSYI